MNQNSSVILGFVENLMFSTRVDSVAEHLGFEMYWMDQKLAMSEEKTLVDRISQLTPALILIDLGMGGISWGSVIWQIKSNSSIQHIPVICFGSHKDTDTLKDARQSGADEVLARSRFFSDIQKYIEKYLG